jgi:hypothetical protein
MTMITNSSSVPLRRLQCGRDQPTGTTNHANNGVGAHPGKQFANSAMSMLALQADERTDE